MAEKESNLHKLTYMKIARWKMQEETLIQFFNG